MCIWGIAMDGDVVRAVKYRRIVVQAGLLTQPAS
jgi:hypothetical protein